VKRKAPWPSFVGAAFALALLASAQPVPAQTTPGATLDRIRQTGTIRLAYRDSDAPFSVKGGGAQPVGFMIALCNAVAAQLGGLANLPTVNVTYVPVTSVDRFDAIRDGRADLLCDSTTMTITRRKVVDFSIPTFIDGAGLLVRGSGVPNLAALAGQKIGVLAGTTTEEAVNNTFREAKVKVAVITVKSYLDGLQMLDAGGINAFFGDRSVLMNLIPQSKNAAALALADDYLTSEPYALALRHGDEDFRLVVDQALSRIYRSGRIADIFAATFGQRPSPVVTALYAAFAFPE
jgi:ABC-type amino acid transport substrate-binding protein